MCRLFPEEVRDGRSELMCGFVVEFGSGGAVPDVNAIGRMTDAILHRGPDDHGTFVSGAVGMGFRRLAILDLSPAGHQPMSTDDGRFTIVFNGEIYNYLELRRELQGLGHQFRSSGDTEVLLAAYRQWGRECLSRLSGMWSFVIYDHERRGIFACRDRFGMKPLYLWRGRDRMLLCSEIKSILASGYVTREINWSTASRYLLDEVLDDTEQSFFVGIEQLPAAHAMEVDAAGRMERWRYWRPDGHAAEACSDPAEHFAELFERAVEMHSRSDVPVAVHLSGGLDSTSILCAMARGRGRPSRAEPLLALTFVGDGFDERRFVADTIAQTQAHLVELLARPSGIWDGLVKVLRYQDEPVHSLTPVVGFELMKMTADRGIKVVLNGQGADEVLGGYASYFPSYWHSLVEGGRPWFAWSELKRYSEAHGGRPLERLAKLGKGLIRSRLSGSSFVSRRALSRYRQHAAARIGFQPALAQHLPDNLPWESRADLDSQLRYSMQRHPLPLYLRIEDRNAMAHSVEGRLPFLDHHLVEFACSLPPEWHLRGTLNKFVLRKAMDGRIPRSVLDRTEKFGFPVPMRSWIGSDEVLTPALDLITSAEARGRGIYDVGRLEQLIRQHGSGEVNAGRLILAVAQFELFVRQSRVQCAAAERTANSAQPIVFSAT